MAAMVHDPEDCNRLNTRPWVVWLPILVIFGSSIAADATSVAPVASPTFGIANEAGNGVTFQYPLTYIKLHGFFMWLAMGLFLPTGVIIVRMTKRAIGNGDSSRKVHSLVYTHLTIQTLGVSFSIVGGTIALKKFETQFAHTHERLGLSILILVWLMPITGFLRPHRGVAVRPYWYGLHWLIGTAAVILGFINIYIGMRVYELITTNSLRSLNILFSIQLSFLGLIYLTQDRWNYMKRQGHVIKRASPPPLEQIQVSAAGGPPQ
eukprot:c47352_g1_i1 orf=443-1234(-)